MIKLLSIIAAALFLYGCVVEVETLPEQPEEKVEPVEAEVVEVPVEDTSSIDDAIRQEIVDDSIWAYEGNCPCPYSEDSAGRSCGKRSAYSREGGETVYCYTSDVPQSEVDRFLSGAEPGPSDEEIREIIVNESTAAYEGNCACPEDKDSAGRNCGKRSAYSRSGIDAVYCYVSDVSDETVDNYRADLELQ